MPMLYPTSVGTIAAVCTAGIISTPTPVSGYQRDAAATSSSSTTNVDGYPPSQSFTQAVWPLPQVFDHPKSVNETTMLSVDPCTFKINPPKGASSVNPKTFGGTISVAIEIYTDIMFGSSAASAAGCAAGMSGAGDEAGGTAAASAPSLASLASLDIVFSDLSAGAKLLANDYLRVSPNATQAEAYSLKIDTSHHNVAELTVSTYPALLRGLEAFAQLLTSPEPTTYVIPAPITINDQPDFSYRGLLIDVSHNFVPMPQLKRSVDGLLASKMNVLHLHLSDTQSFPLQLMTGHGPNITRHGAYSAKELYTVADIAELVKYAADRGVTLVPEIEAPGHSRAIGLTPELNSIVNCAFQPDAWHSHKYYWCNEPPCGQLNITNDLTYTVLQDVLTDVATLFHASPYLHLGFDEVKYDCWTQGDPSYGPDANITQLVTSFFKRQRAMLPASRRAMYWNGWVTEETEVDLSPGDLIQFWTQDIPKSFFQTAPKSVGAIASASKHYYLDGGVGSWSGDEFGTFHTWKEIFDFDLTSGIEAADLAAGRLVGGATAMWTEISPGDIDVKLWPRTSAYGGRLWNYNSKSAYNTSTDLGVALDRQAFRMRSRGINANLIHDQFCDINPSYCQP